MSDGPERLLQRRPSVLVSIGLFVLLTGTIAYLRLYLFHDRFITFTYGLPLLVCFWHRDRRLLWSMAFAFMAMGFYKAFTLLPDVNPTDAWELTQWLFQVVNILVVAGSVHVILGLTETLRARNAALLQANEELQAQGEELAQQNEEIQEQGEELRQQTEEAERQNEELRQQSEELTTQSEELQEANAELAGRERILQTLLKAATLQGGEKQVLQEICTIALGLMGPGVQCAAVVERQEAELVVRAQAGLPSLESKRWPYRNSLAAVAIEHARTACIHDLSERPDLIVPHAPGVPMRASIATPLRFGTEIIGVMEVHSTEPHVWTAQQFQLLEWAAVQSAYVMQGHRLRERLEDLVAERTARLRELVDELEHFSYSITHDLRAPLRAMQGFAGILMKESAELDRKHSQYLSHIVESASRMDRLITDALNYTKAVRADLRLHRVDTQRLFEGIIKSYPNLQASNAKVEVAGPLPPVLANEAGLTQCFSNLLDNAVKFVRPGEQPHVTVRAEVRDGEVKFWIEDNGIGISPDFLPYLFQMFRRASRDYAGTGIGLALVKKTCEKMGGSVGVCSEPGQGSRFWMTLKAAPDAVTPAAWGRS